MRSVGSWLAARKVFRTTAFVMMAVSLMATGGRITQAQSTRPTLIGLNTSDMDRIVNQAVDKANHTASADGLRSNTSASRGPVVTRPTKMWVAIVDREGHLLRIHVMGDAWVGSADIAIAKARTAAFLSSNENFLSSRIVGVLSQAHNPDGTGGAGSLWGIGNSNQVGITGGPEVRNGIITFPGGVPLYKQGLLVGAVGVSGDGVDQDEAVAFAGSQGFEPGANVVKLGGTPPTVTAIP